MFKKLFTTAPEFYSVCVHAQCPKAGECLHRIAFENLRSKKEVMRLVNPDRCTADESCTKFRSNKPVHFARGFSQMKRKMYPDQYKRFMNILIETFGRNPYFERRRGDTALPPSEQELVQQALRKAGVTEKIEFDSYEDTVNWYD